jgi:pyruvate/2-oxoglutarate dehydrogenase complex dihydrolipoamide dehydrogenase (E3) component
MANRHYDPIVIGSGPAGQKSAINSYPCRTAGLPRLVAF